MDDQLDPIQKVELALLRAEHQTKFQVMIDFIKQEVGEGIEYKNSVARVVVSETGAYYELLDLPEEFSGAVGDEIERHFITPKEAIALFTKAVKATKFIDPDITRHFTITSFYTRRGLVDRKNCFVFDYHADTDDKPKPALQVGTFQPNVMPLFYKIKLDAAYAEDIIGARRGIIFCMANAGDRHLLIRIPTDGNGITDLGNVPSTNTIH